MCRRVFTAVAIALLGSATAHAQDLEALGHRVDSLRAAAAAARVELETYRRDFPTKLHFSDSVQIADGQIVVYFNKEVAPAARDGIQEADRVLRELGTAQRRIPRLVFSVVPDTAITPYDRAATHKDMLDVRVHRVGHFNQPNRNSTNPDRASVASVILTEATRQFGPMMDEKFFRWLDAPLPLDPRLRGALQWGLLRLDIVSSQSPLGKACVLGDLRACRVFLGLDSVANPLKTWYDERGRRALVAEDQVGAQRASRAGSRQCLGGNDAACLSVLELMGLGDRAPAKAYVRQSLVVYALNLGGERSAERLVSTKGSIGGALAAAANLPVDSLITEWQRNVAQYGGSSTNLPFSIAIASLVWIAVCTFLALRSSRWR